MVNRSSVKPSDTRAGKRNDRNKKFGTRVPKLGYYLIVIDTEETEKNYFEGLRDIIPSEMKGRLVIKVHKAKTEEIAEKAVELANEDPQYRIPWIVFDRDRVKDFDVIIETAKKYSVYAGWSNPCFEIWMFAYFGEMPAISDSCICCDNFADKYHEITGQKYKKSDKDIYNKLVQYGDAAKAFIIAERRLKKCMDDGKRKPSEMWPACTVYQLVKEIESKIKRKTGHIPT